MPTQDKLEVYRSTYAYKSLMEIYHLDEEGLWQVRGEDPNCDLGGHHHQPNLGVYAGKLKDVLAAAVMMNGFWQWGGGGSIVKIDVKNINDVAKDAERARAEARVRQREKIDQQIAELQRKRAEYED